MTRLLNSMEGLAQLIKWLSICAAVVPAVLALTILWASLRKDTLQRVTDDDKDKKLRQLEQQQTPRKLTDEQKRGAIERFKRFSGQRVQFLIKDLPEPIGFATDLRDVFKDAGWVIEGGPAWINSANVVVLIRTTDKDGRTGHAGGEVVRLLAESSIDFQAGDSPDEQAAKLGTPLSAGVIQVYIGPRVTI